MKSKKNEEFLKAITVALNQDYEEFASSVIVGEIFFDLYNPAQEFRQYWPASYCDCFSEQQYDLLWECLRHLPEYLRTELKRHSTYIMLKASSMGNIRTVQKLIEMGIDVNGANSSQITAMHEAACACDATTVQYLLLCDADIESRNCYGETPLFLAVRMNSFVVANLLLEYGADPYAKNNWGDTPLTYAKSHYILDVHNNQCWLALYRELKKQKTSNERSRLYSN